MLQVRPTFVMFTSVYLQTGKIKASEATNLQGYSICIEYILRATAWQSKVLYMRHKGEDKKKPWGSVRRHINKILKYD